MNSIKNKGNMLAILVCHSPLCSWAGGGGGDVWCLCSSVLSRGGCIPLKSALRGAGSVARKWPRWGYRHSRNGQTSQEHSSWREAHCTPPTPPPAAHLPYSHTEPQKRDRVRVRPHGAPWGRHLPQLHVLPSVGLIGLLHVGELKVEGLRLGDLSGPGQVLHQGHELVVVPAVVVEFCRESIDHLYQTLSYVARRGGSQLQEPPANSQSLQSGLWLPRFLPCPCTGAQNPGCPLPPLPNTLRRDPVPGAQPEPDILLLQGTGQHP